MYVHTRSWIILTKLKGLVKGKLHVDGYYFCPRLLVGDGIIDHRRGTSACEGLAAIKTAKQSYVHTIRHRIGGVPG